MFKIGKFVKDGLHTTRLCVGEEDLTETFAANKGNQAFNTEDVEFVKDVVEEEDGFLARMVEHILELSKFEGKGKTFLLALGSKFFQSKLRGLLRAKKE